MESIVILGPTAIGKTELAISLAKKINAEIISADSMQIYKFMDIGTAKPSKEEQKKVRHHLIDFKMPSEKFSAGEFAKETRRIIESLKKQNKNAIVVGGTGFYVDALINGIDNIGVVDEKIKLFFDDFCEEMGSYELFKWLEIVDESWAKRIHQNDSQRIKRALSVYVSLKKPLSSFFVKSKSVNEFSVFVLTSSKEFLRKRIEKRAILMVESGLIEETKRLLEMGFSDCDALKSIGYKETVEFLEGRIKSKEKLINAIVKSTLEYAKRQLTFFRSKFKDARWIDVESENAEQVILNAVLSHLS
ncbi:tRNA (adenosine(37)-N6)-dimethylallyltransferase MiaA [Hippea alviniae]|uniref:tRNA (adenosine(37)-N6)-dimethylallyltransferase MiaA n=1 Tax=Hippea alviniae TaxID=1279027 RepID=UPI0003B3A2DB|nr:tRNA (adenosine(37)-N6)-dimethylallyltransferase MiaA [Hippea alviniae]